MPTFGDAAGARKKAKAEAQGGNEPPVSKLTIAQLKDRLGALGQPISGVKWVLQKRLRDAELERGDQGAGEVRAAPPTGGGSSLMNILSQLFWTRSAPAVPLSQ